MSDRFHPISMEQLTDWVFDELEQKGSLFGVPLSALFVPKETDRFRTEKYGQVLETPFGVAAGPHTQMAQNIIVSWMVGARFLELKTVQRNGNKGMTGIVQSSCNISHLIYPFQQITPEQKALIV